MGTNLVGGLGGSDIVRGEEIRMRAAPDWTHTLVPDPRLVCRASGAAPLGGP